MNKNRHLYRSLLNGIKLILLSGLLLTLLIGCDKDKRTHQELDDSGIVSAVFSPKTFQKEHKISAFVQSVDQAQLGFQVSGRLSDQWVEIGQQVEVGDKLLSLYNPALKPHIDRIEAQIVANQAELKQSQTELQRNQTLSGIQAVSQNQLDRLQTQVAQLIAQQDTLKAQFQEAKNNYKESTLTAPFAGEVTDIYSKTGTMVQAGQAVIGLSGSLGFEVPIYVGNDLINHLKLKQNLAASIKQQAFNVTVKEISRSANPASQLFKVLVSLPEGTGLRAGQKIEVTIPEPIDNIYQMPVSAVIDDGINEPYIYRLLDDEIQHLPVHVVDFYRNQIWVTIDQEVNRLTVITDGQSTLTPPQKQIKP